MTAQQYLASCHVPDHQGNKHLDKPSPPRMKKKSILKYLEYASPAWSPWHEKYIKELEKVQERALRQIPSLNHLTYEQKLEQLNMTTLKARRIRADLCQVWKILHNYDDVPETRWFSRSQVTAERTTRNSSSPYNLNEPRTRTDIRRNFFSVRVVKPWNSLPE